MGVSGSGKSTIGMLLANRLAVPFVDADDYHSEVNITKMGSGMALTDSDRNLWLLKLNSILQEAAISNGVVMACSALKEKYRKTLQQNLPEKIKWIFLHGTNQLLSKRLLGRKEHFMPADLLQSQLDILEKPDYGIHVDIKNKPEEIIEIICKKIYDEI